MIVPEHLDQDAVKSTDGWHNSGRSRHHDKRVCRWSRDGCLDDDKRYRGVYAGLQPHYSLSAAELSALQSIVINFKQAPAGRSGGFTHALSLIM